MKCPKHTYSNGPCYCPPNLTNLSADEIVDEQIKENIIRQVKTARELTEDSQMLAVLCQIESLATNLSS